MAAGDGLISMTPTSIAVGSGTASINADGGVDFTAVTSLSLNGVFTGDYDNYLIVVRTSSASGNFDMELRLRSSGSDASGANYTFQYVTASSTTVNGNRQTSQTVADFGTFSSAETGVQLHVYGPYLAQPTAGRSVTVSAISSARLDDYAWTHSLSTSYDGITFLHGSENFTGNVHVFGYEE